MASQLLGTRARRWLISIAVLVGVLAAAGLVAVTSAADRTFAGVSNPVQSLISVVVPLYGVVATAELRRSRNRAGLWPALVTAMAMAVGCAVVGSLVVQVVAQLAGTSLGLLIAPRWAAMLATVVLPLGLWFLLGAARPLSAARGWLTPYEALPSLLVDDPDPVGP